jgi:MFS transporter, DHA2 family, methylenomycin A resistance protein
MNAYTLCLATLALSSGSLGDRYGRKRVFLIGVALFTLGSVICAAAPTPLLLIVGRFVQGAGAAVAVPATLSLIAQSFTEPEQRAKVIGGWSTIAGVALAGPTAGGLLVQAGPASSAR